MVHKKNSHTSKANLGKILELLQKFPKIQNQQPRNSIPLPLSPHKHLQTFKYSNRPEQRSIWIYHGVKIPGPSNAPIISYKYQTRCTSTLLRVPQHYQWFSLLMFFHNVYDHLPLPGACNVYIQLSKVFQLESKLSGCGAHITLPPATTTTQPASIRKSQGNFRAWVRYSSHILPPVQTYQCNSTSQAVE